MAHQDLSAKDKKVVEGSGSKEFALPPSLLAETGGLFNNIKGGRESTNAANLLGAVARYNGGVSGLLPKVYGMYLSPPFSKSSSPGVFFPMQNLQQDGSGDHSIKPCNDCVLLLAYQPANVLSAGRRIERSCSLLHRSAISGCPLCQALLRKFRWSVATRLNQPSTAILPTETDVKLNVRVKNLARNASLVLTDEESPEQYLEYRLVRKSNSVADSAKWLTSSWSSDRRVDSKECFDLVRGWISMCDSEHQSCRRSDVPLPTRVVDISDNKHPRLLKTNGLRGRYAAISYSWGSDPFLKTTKATEKDHIASINPDDLPKTFRDVITVAHEIGIQFIWIDSLCIVQDCAQDTNTELGRMDRIYKNSSITICAASTTRCDDSFLARKMNTSVDGAIPIRLDFPSSSPYGHHTSVQLVEMGHRRPQIDPLHSRAWTMQETILSPRLLIYSRTQLFFVCEESTYEGAGLDDWGTYCKVSGFHRLWGQPRATIRGSAVQREIPDNVGVILPSVVQTGVQDAARTISLEESWNQIITGYARRKLTFESDNLKAISAIASEFSLQMKDQYIAGHWRNWLPGSLLWRLKEISGARTKTWTAPSWSWLSPRAPVEMLEDLASLNRGTVAEVVECSSQPESSAAPFGAIESASLTINSYRIEVSLDKNKGARELFLGPQTSPSTNVAYTHWDPPFPDEDRSKLFKGSLLGAQYPPPDPNSTLFCLPIMKSKRGIVEGLILMRTGKNTFRRRGVFLSKPEHADCFLRGKKFHTSLV